MKSQIIILQNVLVIILLIIPKVLPAQDLPFLGPRSLSLGHTSITLGDEFSIFNNPGSLGIIKKGSIASGYMSLYQVEGLNSVFATVSTTFNNGTFSIGAFGLGDDIYNSKKLSLGFGNRFGLASLGAGINYHHFYFEGLDSYGFITLDIGGVAEINPFLSFGAAVKNLTQTRMSKYTGEYFPTLMSTGVSYKPSDLLTLCMQYDKDLNLPGQLKFGLEYCYSALIFRAGIITDPSLLSFGLGFHHKKLRIDYGIVRHQILNASHSVSISYHFKDE